MSISLLRQLLMKEAVKKSAGSSGIMTINKNISQEVEKQVQKYVNDALAQGVDLDTLSESQLKYIIELNKPKIPKVYSGQEAMDQLNQLFPQKGKILPFKQKRSFAEEIEAMKKSGDIVDEDNMVISEKITDREMFKDASKRFNKTDVIADTVARITSMEPVAALKEANKVIKREGIYKNLDKTQSKKILADTEDWIFQRNTDDLYDYNKNRPFRDDPNFDPDDPDYQNYVKNRDKDDYATGGRAGYSLGSLVSQARQENDGIEARLEQLGGDVTAAEQLLQQINERLESAGSSVPEGGGQLTQLPGGLGTLASGVPTGLNRFPEGAPTTPHPNLLRPGAAAQPVNFFNADLPNKLTPIDPYRNTQLAGLSQDGQRFDSAQGAFDALADYTKKQREANPYTRNMIGTEMYQGDKGFENFTNYFNQVNDPSYTAPSPQLVASSQQNLQKALPGLFADGGVAGLLGEKKETARQSYREAGYVEKAYAPSTTAKAPPSMGFGNPPSNNKASGGDENPPLRQLEPPLKQIKPPTTGIGTIPTKSRARDILSRFKENQKTQLLKNYLSNDPLYQTYVDRGLLNWDNIKSYDDDINKLIENKNIQNKGEQLGDLLKLQSGAWGYTRPWNRTDDSLYIDDIDKFDPTWTPGWTGDSKQERLNKRIAEVIGHEARHQVLGEGMNVPYRSILLDEEINQIKEGINSGEIDKDVGNKILKNLSQSWAGDPYSQKVDTNLADSGAWQNYKSKYDANPLNFKDTHELVTTMGDFQSYNNPTIYDDIYETVHGGMPRNLSSNVADELYDASVQVGKDFSARTLGEKYENIDPVMVEGLKRAYPDEDIDQTLREMSTRQVMDLLQDNYEYDKKYAKGGRAGHYTGGMVDVEPNLSDIGHGADALMARTRLMSPGSQATTSTGLNYLLAEDNDNIRIPFSAGGDAGRRAFLKLLAALTGGVAAAKSGILSLGGKEGTKKAITETVKQSAGSGTPPPYFFRLVEKIKFMGDDTLATQDKAIAKKYKDYIMEEDFAGNIEIVKKGEDLAGNKLEDVYMSYKVDDVALKNKKGFAKVEEYEEFTARPDMEGKMKDVEPGVPDEVVEEAGNIDAMTLKKADGGLITMLGE